MSRVRLTPSRLLHPLKRDVLARLPSLGAKFKLPSGEQRISNFLLWQLAYTELYFTEVLWPDFSEEDLLLALREFQSRERRFGGTN